MKNLNSLTAFWRGTSLTINSPHFGVFLLGSVGREQVGRNETHHKSLLPRNSNSCAFGMTTLGIGATLSSRTWPQIVNSDRKRDLFTEVLIGQFLGT